MSLLPSHNSPTSLSPLSDWGPIACPSILALQVSARLSYEGQLKAYQHALRHIENNDFQKNDVQSIEYNAHQLNTEKVIPVPAQKYLERIRELQKERRRIQRQIKKDQERVKFIMDNSDLYKLAEHQYLYGDEL